jgi:heat shock protein HtpX
MIHALQRLGGLQAGALPQGFRSFGIAGGGGIASLFASHPPLDKRIEALQHMGAR